MPMRLPLSNTQTPITLLQNAQSRTQKDAKRYQTTPTDLENRNVHHQRTQSKHGIPGGNRNSNSRMAQREQRLGMWQGLTSQKWWRWRRWRGWCQEKGEGRGGRERWSTEGRRAGERGSWLRCFFCYILTMEFGIIFPVSKMINIDSWRYWGASEEWGMWLEHGRAGDFIFYVFLLFCYRPWGFLKFAITCGL